MRTCTQSSGLAFLFRDILGVFAFPVDSYTRRSLLELLLVATSAKATGDARGETAWDAGLTTAFLCGDDDEMVRMGVAGGGKVGE